jgi:hypothetical protein
MIVKYLEIETNNLRVNNSGRSEVIGPSLNLIHIHVIDSTITNNVNIGCFKQKFM